MFLRRLMNASHLRHGFGRSNLAKKVTEGTGLIEVYSMEKA